MRTAALGNTIGGATLGHPAAAIYGRNGNPMKSGGTYTHLNGVTLRNTAGSMFYAAGTGTTFLTIRPAKRSTPPTVTLRDTAGVYTYETGAQLDNNNVIDYPSGATMIDASGNVFNADGSPATTPFSEHDTFTNSEVTTTVSGGDYEITIAAKQTVSGSAAAYVTRIHLIYPVTGDYNLDGHVDAADYVLWRKNLGNVTPLPNDNGLGTPIGQQHYDLWRANFGQIAPAPGAGADVGQAVPDESDTNATTTAAIAAPGLIATYAPAHLSLAAGLSNFSTSSTAARLDILPPAPQTTDLALLNWLNAQPAAPTIQNHAIFDHASTQPDPTSPTSPSATDDLDAAFTSLATISDPLRLRASA